MKDTKWYVLKAKNSQAITINDILPKNKQIDLSTGYLAKGPKEHCLFVKSRLESFNYPGDLYLEECKNDLEVFPRFDTVKALQEEK